MPRKDPPGEEPTPSDSGDAEVDRRSDDVDDDDRLLAALRAADHRPPWTVDLVRDAAADPSGTRATALQCASCDAPCRDEEVCATVIAHECGLLDEVGRARAFHLVESGMKRLRTRDEATIREDGDHRPNVFVALTPEED